MNPSALFAVHLDKITRPSSRNALSGIEGFVTRWLFRRLMRKSWSRMWLAETMTELAIAARDAFPEDNDATVAEFLKDSLNDGIRKSLPHA